MKRTWTVLRIVAGVGIMLLGVGLLTFTLRQMFQIDREAFQHFEFEPQVALQGTQALSNYSSSSAFPFPAGVMSAILMVIASIAVGGLLLALKRFSLRTALVAGLFVCAVGAVPMLWLKPGRNSTLRLVMITKEPLAPGAIDEISSALQPDAALQTLTPECLSELDLEPEDHVQRVTVEPALGSNGKAAFSCCVTFQNGVDNWKKAALMEFYECYAMVLAMEKSGYKGDAMTVNYGFQNGVSMSSFGQSNKGFWATHQQRWLAVRQRRLEDAKQIMAERPDDGTSAVQP